MLSSIYSTFCHNVNDYWSNEIMYSQIDTDRLIVIGNSNRISNNKRVSIPKNTTTQQQLLQEHIKHKKHRENAFLG